MRGKTKKQTKTEKEGGWRAVCGVGVGRWEAVWCQTSQSERRSG